MLTTDKFSRKAIKKAVLQETVQKPLTLYPAVVGLLGAFSVLLFGATTVTLSAVIVGSVLTSLGWLYEYFGKGENYSLQYLENIHKKIKEESERKLLQLERELNDVNAEQASNQLSSLVNKFEAFQTILSKKFEQGELTYSRYLGIAEQVFLAALDNLENMYLALKSISAVDEAQIRRKIAKIQEDESHKEEQLEALRKRIEIKQQQLKRIDKLLVQNEKALTELDNVTTKLANVQTQKGRASVAMDLAMEELSRIAENTERYKHS